MKAPVLRGPAAAFTWAFGRRHRRGFLALGAYLLVLAVARVVMGVGGLRMRIDDTETFALVVLAPMTMTFVYFLAVFTYGLEGDIAARESMYPRRLLTLPVSNAALVGWPMLLGSVAMMALWAATRFLAVWPAGAVIPVVWPAFLAAGILAWTQAMTWMPYGLRGVRPIAAIIVLQALDVVAIYAVQHRSSEGVFFAIALPQVPLAYLVARWAVARARAGVVPDWSRAFAWTGHLARAARGRAPFSSPAEAQAWFEWRSTGRSLPVLVAIVLPFELLLFWTAGNAESLLWEYLAIVAFTPPLLAGFLAWSIPKSRPDGGLAPFLATRPMTGAELVAAKLRMTAVSSLAAWTVVGVGVPLALWWSGTWSMVVERLTLLRDGFGTPRFVVVLTLVPLWFMLMTWRQLVQVLCVGLTGRDGVTRASMTMTLLVLLALGLSVDWLSGAPAARGAVWDAIPLILAAIAVAKTAAGAWVAARFHRERLVSDRTLVVSAALWCGAVLALWALFMWFVDSPFLAGYQLLLVAILSVPLARVSAAPLALAWNRHR